MDWTAVFGLILSHVGAGGIALLLFALFVNRPLTFPDWLLPGGRAPSKADDAIGPNQKHELLTSPYPLTVVKESEFPDGYWSAESVYALERRAWLSQVAEVSGRSLKIHC